MPDVVMRFFSAVLLMAAACGAPRPEPAVPAAVPLPAVRLRFMEAAGPKEPPDKPRRWREIKDSARLSRLTSLTNDEAARFALALQRLAWEIAPPAAPAPTEPTLFIAVEKGGNVGRVGFVLEAAAGGVLELPAMPYLIVDEEPRTFSRTLVHEGGHVVHALLASGATKLNDDEGAIAPIPHTTAAVTDRRTAWNEGFAEHLETVNAFCGRAPETRAFYDRARFPHGDFETLDAEYFGPLRDVRTYAQNLARFHAVRDGLYAFEPANRTDDYLRLQLDPARDLRALRSGGALLSSEGFAASLWFQVVVADGCDGLADVVPRYRPLLAALHRAELTSGPLVAAPIVAWVAQVGPPAIDAFLDLSHGATIDPEAAAVWAALYDASLTIDRERLLALKAEVGSRRRHWQEAARRDPSTLLTTVGPVVVLRIAARTAGVPAFGPPQPLLFDVNAAGPPMLRVIPGLREEQIAAIVADRQRRPFADPTDFFKRTDSLGLPRGALVLPE